MRKVCADFEAVPREFNGEHDHVHLFAGYPPKAAISALVNSLKGASARRLRPQYPAKVNPARMNGHFSVLLRRLLRRRPAAAGGGSTSSSSGARPEGLRW